jgi:hypothetical protein
VTTNDVLSLEELARRSGRPREALIEEALPGLPTDVHNALRRNDVHTLGDLLDRGETGLAAIRNFGPHALDCVKADLVQHTPSMVTPKEAAQILRVLLDEQELFTRIHGDGSMVDVRSGRATEFLSGPITHVTIQAAPEGPAYAIAPPPLPDRDAGQSRILRYAREAAIWIRDQTLYPYECLMDCGNPAGVGCEPFCQSYPEDRYTPPPPPPQPEDIGGGGAFTDEPPFPDPDRWDATTASQLTDGRA